MKASCTRSVGIACCRLGSQNCVLGCVFYMLALYAIHLIRVLQNGATSQAGANSAGPSKQPAAAPTAVKQAPEDQPPTSAAAGTSQTHQARVNGTSSAPAPAPSQQPATAPQAAAGPTQPASSADARKAQGSSEISAAENAQHPAKAQAPSPATSAAAPQLDMAAAKPPAASPTAPTIAEDSLLARLPEPLKQLYTSTDAFLSEYVPVDKLQGVLGVDRGSAWAVVGGAAVATLAVVSSIALRRRR